MALNDSISDKTVKKMPFSKVCAFADFKYQEQNFCSMAQSANVLFGAHTSRIRA